MKPMLAERCTDPTALQFPVWATPKLDGIRCLKLDGRAVSRNLKPIASPFIREVVERDFPDGVDGEIIIPGKKFNETSSAVMSKTTTETAKTFEYWVFDFVHQGQYDDGYLRRVANLQALPQVEHMNKILPIRASNAAELQAYELQCIAAGYEGAMVRSADGPYKFGRSTVREGYLLKLKRFTDHEAIVVGFEERLHNANEATEDALGHTKRSSHKANMVPTGMLGALIVQDITSGVVFNIGTGFDDNLRKTIWEDKSRYMGMVVKYKSQSYGAKDAPRFPVFLGFRDVRDM